MCTPRLPGPRGRLSGINEGVTLRIYSGRLLTLAPNAVRAQAVWKLRLVSLLLVNSNDDGEPWHRLAQLGDGSPLQLAAKLTAIAGCSAASKRVRTFSAHLRGFNGRGANLVLSTNFLFGMSFP